jgi:uncharacterized protein
MDTATLAVFLLATALGSYVQAVTGFAMGMIIVAVMVGGGVIAVPLIAAVVSLLSFVNILLALRGHAHQLVRPLFVRIAIGLLPAIAIGVWLLTWLDARAQWMVELLLGVFVIGGSLSMLLRPRPLAAPSAPWACVSAGFWGGLLAGLFSASGPVLGWFAYRQPLTVAAIRTTLLAVFALTTSLRTLVVGAGGGLTTEVWILFLTGLPLVLAGTWAGRRLPPPVSEAALKRLAFTLLLVMGCWSVVRAIAASV